MVEKDEDVVAVVCCEEDGGASDGDDVIFVMRVISPVRAAAHHPQALQELAGVFLKGMSTAARSPELSRRMAPGKVVCRCQLPRPFIKVSRQPRG